MNKPIDATNADPHWFKDAVIYEVRLRSFYDSNGDGIGDIRGLTQKLDYIRDLGVDTIWLLPFYPSPLIDDGYDIADYTGIAPELGTLRDFKRLLTEAHARGLRIVTELVLNHTSDQHPWFQRARKAPAGSRSRNFYVWSDDPSGYAGARIIFQDFESSNWTWDAVAGQYFWHRFYSNQPDLNFDNPDVQKAMLGVVDFWLGMGVDGLRLDAVPYLFEREGTNCENLPETHDFLKRLRAHVDKKFPGRMLLAEANQWPEDAVAYFGDDDECHMCFHFPIMPRLFMALRMEDSFPILDILEQTPEIPPGCQWAIFLRNHDELTLEMVTDEERDYMVSAYAADRHARVNLGIRRRLAPLLENHRSRIELMKALLFSLPGTPVLYYGDEIGMGDNVYLGDRNGVRTPMQWSGDRNAGFSTANPQKLVLPPVQDPEYHFAAINVEAQQQNPSSLLWWTKRLIDLRRHFQAFSRGTLEPLFPKNRRVLAFLRRHEDEVILVVANLSRWAQYVELDLAEFSGAGPRELFGNGEFPKVGDRPYVVTLGPHGFYVFSLAEKKRPSRTSHHAFGMIKFQGSWDSVLASKKEASLTKAIARHLPTVRWYREKSRPLKGITVEDKVPLTRAVWLLVLLVHHGTGEPTRYCLPVRFQAGAEEPEGSIVALMSSKDSGYLVDASNDPEVADALLKLLRSGRSKVGSTVELLGVPSASLRAETKGGFPPGRALGAEQTNTTYGYGTQYVLKFFRRVDGESPELDVLTQLSTTDFRNYPKLLGHIEINSPTGTSATLAIAQAYVENQGDAWSLAVDAVARFYEEALALGPPPEPHKGSLLRLMHQEPLESIAGALGPFLTNVDLLGQRTAEMHRALATGSVMGFKPEPFGALSKRSFYQSLRNLAAKAFDGIRGVHSSLSPDNAELASELLRHERTLRERIAQVRDANLTATRIRVHGDFHLGQVLHTGKDFVVLDFEGEPARSPSQRRALRSPLADVAGMLRSFDYAAHFGILEGQVSAVRDADRETLTGWAHVWQTWAGARYLRHYFDQVSGTDLVPEDAAERQLLLDAYLIEKALYELTYEIDNRPGWVSAPLRGLLRLL